MPTKLCWFCLSVPICAYQCLSVPISACRLTRLGAACILFHADCTMLCQRFAACLPTTAVAMADRHKDCAQQPVHGTRIDASGFRLA